MVPFYKEPNCCGL